MFYSKEDLDRVTRYMNTSLPDNDIKRVIKKLKSIISHSTIADIFMNMDVNDVEPSSLNLVMCTKIMNEYLKENRDKTHPSHDLDAVIISEDVTFEPSGYTYDVEGKSVKVENKLGFFCNDTKRCSLASTSSAVAVHTMSNKTGLQPIITEDESKDLQVHRLDLVKQRHAFAKHTSSYIARDEIYSFLSRNQGMGLIINDDILGHFPFTSTSDKLKKALQVAKSKIATSLPEPVGRFLIPCTTTMDIKNASVKSVMIYRHKLVQKFGDTQKRGAVFNTSYFGEISSSLHKDIVLTAQMKLISVLCNVTAFRIVDKKPFSLQLLKMIVANGISVVSSFGSLKGDTKTTGLFRYYTGVTMTYEPNVFSDCTFYKTGLMFNPRNEQEMDLFLEEDKGEKKFTISQFNNYIVSAYIQGHVDIIPYITPYSCKVIVLNTASAITEEKKRKDYVNQLLQRSYLGCNHRANFFVTRLPGYQQDGLKSYFEEKKLFPIVIPKIVVRPIKEETDEKIIACIKPMDIKSEFYDDYYGDIQVLEVMAPVDNTRIRLESLCREYESANKEQRVALIMTSNDEDISMLKDKYGGDQSFQDCYKISQEIKDAESARSQSALLDQSKSQDEDLTNLNDGLGEDPDADVDLDELYKPKDKKNSK